MLKSELIKKLEAIEGDFPVFIRDVRSGVCDSVTGVSDPTMVNMSDDAGDLCAEDIGMIYIQIYTG